MSKRRKRKAGGIEDLRKTVSSRVERAKKEKELGELIEAKNRLESVSPMSTLEKTAEEKKLVKRIVELKRELGKI